MQRGQRHVLSFTLCLCGGASRPDDKTAQNLLFSTLCSRRLDAPGGYFEFLRRCIDLKLAPGELVGDSPGKIAAHRRRVKINEIPRLLHNVALFIVVEPRHWITCRSQRCVSHVCEVRILGRGPLGGFVTTGPCTDVPGSGEALKVHDALRVG